MKLIKYLFLVTVSTLFFFLSSCQPLVTNMYYIQQQSREENSEEENESEWKDEDEETKDEELPDGYISVFSVICRDGYLDETLFTQDTKDSLKNIRERLPVTAGFSSDDILERSLICSSFSSENVPNLWYKKGNWDPGIRDKNEFFYNGEDTTAGKNKISSVIYYSYRGQSPFFSADSSYNTAGYSDDEEARMKRFVFYRFSGKTALPELDNYLVAVDSYTRLFFAFAIPTEYKSYFGQNVPKAWGPVDQLCADSTGNRHKFYEYDPAGYIDDDGIFINMEWYISNLAAGKYDPVYTGLSPYTVVIQSGESIVPSVQASSVSVNGIKEDSKGYYTEIKIAQQAVEMNYSLMRLDDSSAEWQIIEDSIRVGAGKDFTYRDYGGLYLNAFPKYKVKANTADGDFIAESVAVEGSRMLSDREVLLGAMNSIRLSFQQLWYKTAAAGGELKKDSITVGAGTYFHGIDRNETFLGTFFGDNYRRYQRYEEFSNSLFTLNGTFMKDEGSIFYDKKGTWQHDVSIDECVWPDDEEFLPRTESLSVEYGGKVFQLKFSKVVIKNNKGDEPEWTSGSMIVESGRGSSEYDKDSGFPFVLFMSDKAFFEAVK